MNLKKVYKATIIALLLLPNIFVVLLGIESFPYTCAPMFGHYINDETNLYLFEFEGETNNKKIDLIDYLGKSEVLFMRHFFSKVYGSTDAISPFSNKLSESETDFQHRMDAFFFHYYTYLKKKYNMSLSKINLKVVQVNQERKILKAPEIIGYFNCENKSYVSKMKNTNN